MNDFVDYCFCSDWDGNGEIYSVENKIVWRFQSTGLKLQPPGAGPHPDPVFCFSDADRQELATIGQERRFPMAQFVVVENGLRLCTILQRSVWFTKYELEFRDKSKWTLRMPMFSVAGRAVSESGAEIWWRARTRKQWYVKIGVGFDNPPMLAALAYVIRKKLQRT